MSLQCLASYTVQCASGRTVSQRARYCTVVAGPTKLPPLGSADLVCFVLAELRTHCMLRLFSLRTVLVSVSHSGASGLRSGGLSDLPEGMVFHTVFRGSTL